MSLGLFDDVTTVTIGGNAIAGIKQVVVSDDPRKIEGLNNGVTDGPVCLTTVHRNLTITIASEDVAMIAQPTDDVPVTIAWTTVPVANTIYTTATAHTYTYTSMVPLTGTKTHSSKEFHAFSKTYKILSGGTLTIT